LSLSSIVVADLVSAIFRMSIEPNVHLARSDGAGPRCGTTARA
jgi:hypothetical protein